MSIRDKLLTILEKEGTSVFSGARLAKALGITRTSVWKHVRELRSIGFPIKSAVGNGYRLSAPVDFSLRKPRWSSSVAAWLTYHYQLTTTSTQTLARQAAEQQATEGNLWVSEIQSRGRGRLDRAWDSGFGGLWFSFILKPLVPPARVPPLSLVASLCLAEAIEALSAVPAVVKWPNDVLLADGNGRYRKAAGILTQMSGELDRTHWVVMGIGVNVNNHVSPTLAPSAVSLFEKTGRVFSRAALLDGFLQRFLKRYRIFTKEGFGVFQKDYWKHYSRPDAAIQLRTAQRELSGVARGVDASGALIVESRRQIHAILEGEIIA